MKEEMKDSQSASPRDETPAEWLGTVDVKALEAAAYNLSAAFIYRNTPEGGPYWYGIQTRLEAMAKQARAAGKHKRPPSQAKRIPLLKDQPHDA